jgi:hypothetical protein
VKTKGGGGYMKYLGTPAAVYTGLHLQIRSLVERNDRIRECEKKGLTN